MTLEEIKNSLPDYARDMKHNLSVVLNEKGVPGLTMKQLSAVAIAASLTAPSKKLAEAVRNFSLNYLTETEIDGAATAHTIMSMTNVGLNLR